MILFLIIVLLFLILLSFCKAAKEADEWEEK